MAVSFGARRGAGQVAGREICPNRSAASRAGFAHGNTTDVAASLFRVDRSLKKLQTREGDEVAFFGHTR